MSKGFVTLSKICNTNYCTSTCASDSQSGEVQNTYCKSKKNSESESRIVFSIKGYFFKLI